MSRFEEANALAGDLRALAADVMQAFSRAPKEGFGGHGLVFLARGTTSLESVQVLAKAGLGADATSVSRTIIELYVELRFLVEEDSQRRFELFFGHEFVRDWLLAKAIERLHEGLAEQSTKDAMKELEKRHGEVKANYPRFDWASSLTGYDSLRKRAVAVGAVHLYDLAYADACATSHAGPQGLRHAYLTAEDARTTTVTLLVGGGEPAARPVEIACWAFIGLLATAINLCGLQAEFDDRHDELGRRLSALTASK